MGHVEIVQILAPLVNNSNDPDEDGRTPIQQAKINGHTAQIILKNCGCEIL